MMGFFAGSVLFNNSLKSNSAFSVETLLGVTSANVKVEAHKLNMATDARKFLKLLINLNFRTLYDRMSDISDTTTINQILLSGFLIFSSQTSKVKTTPVAILDFVIRSF